MQYHLRGSLVGPLCQGERWRRNAARGPGLAGRIVRVTLLVGAVTVLTAGAVAVYGASQLASNIVRPDCQLLASDRPARDRRPFQRDRAVAAEAAVEVALQLDTQALDAKLEPITVRRPASSISSSSPTGAAG